MSDKKKISLCKPPVPARPKNLVVLNSKHLPKPPETSTENVTNFIKDLNLDIKDEGNDLNKFKQGQRFESNSDGEDDTYGYLEPVSLSPVPTSDGSVNGKNSYGHKKFGCDENSRLGGILKKVINRNSSGVSVAKPVGANLGRRISYEMADFGFNFKRRFRRRGKPEVETEKSYLEVISELPELEETKPQIAQSQWHRPLPSLPLPPTETKVDVTSMPWYKNIDRKKGEEILRNGVNGYFLVRPSSNADTYLTLTLWYNNRVYNIPIRKRKDGRFALGTPKANEQSFETIEYMVKNYQSEKLVLYSNGVQTGKTLLTTYPP